MNYTLIEAFLAVTSSESISKAADSLFITQSALSQRIKLLESQLGLQLITHKRGAHSIQLTPDGVRFLPIAYTWKDLYQKTKVFGQRKRQKVFSIASINVLNNFTLCQFYEQLLLEHDDIDFHITTDKSYALYDLVENRSVDLALCNRKNDSPNVIRKLLCTEPFYYICSAFSTCNPKEKVSLQNLDPSHGVFMRWTPEITNWYEYHFGASAQRQISTDSWFILQQLILHRDYWSTIPASMIPFLNRDHIFVSEFQEPPPRRELYLLSRRNSDVAPEFLEQISKQLYLYLDSLGYFSMCD